MEFHRSLDIYCTTPKSLADGFRFLSNGGSGVETKSSRFLVMFPPHTTAVFVACIHLNHKNYCRPPNTQTSRKFGLFWQSFEPNPTWNCPCPGSTSGIYGFDPGYLAQKLIPLSLGWAELPGPGFPRLAFRGVGRPSNNSCQLGWSQLPPRGGGLCIVLNVWY